MDLDSTAEALLFLQRPFIDRHPDALQGFRILVDGDPAIAQVSKALAAASSDGTPWSERMESVVMPTQGPALARLQERVGGVRALLDAAYAKKAAEDAEQKADEVPLGALRPSVIPSERSGLTVKVYPCGQAGLTGSAHDLCEAAGFPEDQGVVEIVNRYARWVSAWIEASDGSVPDIGPITIASATMVPELWNFVISGFDTELFFGDSATTSVYRLVDFNPTLDGANTYYLTAYGMGAQPSYVP